MHIKAECLKGRTVVSSDGKARWSEDGQVSEVSDIAGAALLASAPKGMFSVASSTKEKEEKPEKASRGILGRGQNKSAQAPKNK